MGASRWTWYIVNIFLSPARLAVKKKMNFEEMVLILTRIRVQLETKQSSNLCEMYDFQYNSFLFNPQVIRQKNEPFYTEYNLDNFVR